MSEHNPTWENTLNSNKTRYGSIGDAAKAAFNIGYQFICWNDRIYAVHKAPFAENLVIGDTRLTIEDLAANKIPKRHIIVAGRGASGEPVLETFKVAYTKKQEEMGVHYDKAIDMAEADGMRSPFICYDEHEYQEIIVVAERLNNIK